MGKNLTVSFIAGILLSAVALYFAFKNVPFGELIHYIASINYWWVLPSVLLVWTTFFLRAARWRTILQSSQNIGIWQAYHPLMIGFMMNCVLPGRVGEFARPAILKKREKTPFATGLATVAAERVFDIFFLMVMFIAAFSLVEINPDLNLEFGSYQINQETLVRIFKGMVKLGILLIAGIAMVSFSSTRKVMQVVIGAIPRVFFFAGPKFQSKLTEKFCEPLNGFVENIALGFNLVKQPKKIILCVLYSLSIWSLHVISYWLIALGSPGMNLSVMEILVMLVIIMFIIALPSVPGFWGLWEAGGVFALSLFGVSAKDAAGFTLTNHAVQMFPVIIAGFISAMIISTNIWQLSFNNAKASPPADS